MQSDLLWIRASEHVFLSGDLESTCLCKPQGVLHVTLSHTGGSEGLNFPAEQADQWWKRRRGCSLLRTGWGVLYVLLRQWCGHGVAGDCELLLVACLLDSMRSNGRGIHVDELVGHVGSKLLTSTTARPNPGTQLPRWDIPVWDVPVRRGWWR